MLVRDPQAAARVSTTHLGDKLCNLVQLDMNRPAVRDIEAVHNASLHALIELRPAVRNRDAAPAFDQLISRRALGDADLDALQVGGRFHPADVVRQLAEATTRHDGQRTDVHVPPGRLVEPFGEPAVQDHVGPFEIAEEIRQVDHVVGPTERADVLGRRRRNLDQVLLHLFHTLVLDTDGAGTVKLDDGRTVRILLDARNEMIEK